MPRHTFLLSRQVNADLFASLASQDWKNTCSLLVLSPYHAIAEVPGCSTFTEPISFVLYSDKGFTWIVGGHI